MPEGRVSPGRVVPQGQLTCGALPCAYDCGGDLGLFTSRCEVFDPKLVEGATEKSMNVVGPRSERKAGQLPEERGIETGDQRIATRLDYVCGSCGARAPQNGDIRE